jgi:hypothetical protein
MYHILHVCMRQVQSVAFYYNITYNYHKPRSIAFQSTRVPSRTHCSHDIACKHKYRSSRSHTHKSRVCTINPTLTPNWHSIKWDGIHLHIHVLTQSNVWRLRLVAKVKRIQLAVSHIPLFVSITSRLPYRFLSCSLVLYDDKHCLVDSLQDATWGRQSRIFAKILSISPVQSIDIETV